MVQKIGAQAQPQARTTGKPQTKPQANQNIVIEFSSLPAQLKTEKVRSFYDKDGSGFLESNNSQGQNEISLMAEFAKSMGIDLSKYKSNIAKVVRTNCNHEGTREMSRAYDSKGKWVMDLEIYNDNSVLTYETSMTQAKYNKEYASNDYSLITEQKINSRGAADNVKEKLDGGMTYYGDYNKKYGELKDKNGKIIATDDWTGKDDKFNLYQERTLVKGKNTLVATRCYSGTNQIANGVFIQRGQLPNDIEKFPLTKTTFTLNGKPVQAKPIGKGRYEVTDKKGNVSYISHDGVKLKPEYVRSNP